MSLVLPAHRSRSGAHRTVPSTALDSSAEAGTSYVLVILLFSGAKHKLPSCGLLGPSVGFAAPVFFPHMGSDLFLGRQSLGGFTHHLRDQGTRPSPSNRLPSHLCHSKPSEWQ